LDSLERGDIHYYYQQARTWREANSGLNYYAYQKGIIKGKGQLYLYLIIIKHYCSKTSRNLHKNLTVYYLQ